ANLLDRRSSLLTDQIEALREATRRAHERHPFHIDAFVVLPDHIHAIWTLPEGDADFSMRWRLIKIVFSKSIPKTERLSKVRRARGERGIWQRRFSGLTRTTAVTLNIATSIPSSTDLSRAYAIGRSRRFTATWRPACFRKTGRASSRRSVNSARRQWRNKAIAPYDKLHLLRSGSGTQRKCRHVRGRLIAVTENPAPRRSYNPASRIGGWKARP